MAMTMSPASTNRWNSDDQAVAIILDAHWDRFFDEPKYASHTGSQSRKHDAYCKALGTLARAVHYLQTKYPPMPVRD